MAWRSASGLSAESAAIENGHGYSSWLDDRWAPVALSQRPAMQRMNLPCAAGQTCPAPIAASRRPAMPRRPSSSPRRARPDGQEVLGGGDVVRRGACARRRRRRLPPPPASPPAARAGPRRVSAPTKSLRETASRIGRSSARSCSSAASTSIVWAGVLEKSGPGSTISCSNATPRSHRQLDPRLQELPHVLDDPPVERAVVQTLLGRRDRVHEHERGTGLRAHVGERRVAQAADVVDDARAGGHRRPSHRRLVGIDRDARPELGDDPLDQRHDPRDLLLGGHGRPIGHAGLAADVDQLGALGEQRPPPARRARPASDGAPSSENESGVALTIPISIGRRPSSSVPALVASRRGGAVTTARRRRRGPPQASSKRQAR